METLLLSVFIILCRLSEPNMASISGQLEELYMAHSRKDMNDTLTSALMGACVTASAMPSRLMMEHVFLVSILHHTVGIEVQLYLFSRLSLVSHGDYFNDRLDKCVIVCCGWFLCQFLFVLNKYSIVYVM